MTWGLILNPGGRAKGIRQYAMVPTHTKICHAPQRLKLNAHNKKCLQISPYPKDHTYSGWYSDLIGYYHHKVHTPTNPERLSLTHRLPYEAEKISFQRRFESLKFVKMKWIGLITKNIITLMIHAQVYMTLRCLLTHHKNAAIKHGIGNFNIKMIYTCRPYGPHMKNLVNPKK